MFVAVREMVGGKYVLTDADYDGNEIAFGPVFKTAREADEFFEWCSDLTHENAAEMSRRWMDSKKGGG